MSPLKRPPACADVFDLLTYGEEEFGPEPEVKKKRRKPRRKKKAEMVLLFGGENKDSAVKKLKEIKNLKTPKAAASKPQFLCPRRPVPTHAPALLPPPPAVDSSAPGHSRDCDDFLPSYDDNDHPGDAVFSAPRPPAPRFRDTSPPASTISFTSSACSTSTRFPQPPRYKVLTPMLCNWSAKAL